MVTTRGRNPAVQGDLKDGKSEVIEEASYTVGHGTAIFRKKDGKHTAIVSFSEVRSITELEATPVPGIA